MISLANEPSISFIIGCIYFGVESLYIIFLKDKIRDYLEVIIAVFEATLSVSCCEFQKFCKKGIW
jgi:hypothetical protein